MSRAFVKETDGAQPGDELPERPQSPHPNYVTPGGLKALQRRVEKLQEERRHLTETGEPEMLDKEHLKLVERDLRYWQERVQSAILVEPSSQPQDKVGFGATVDTVDDDDVKRSFTIVGEDEAEPKSGKISWVSPLAKTLSGAGVGDTVTWKRPAGDISLEITAIRYPKS
ncbi:MAG: GreA/GreB family elongation factor [Pseudomonadota bacterium]